MPNDGDDDDIPESSSDEEEPELPCDAEEYCDADDGEGAPVAAVVTPGAASAAPRDQLEAIAARLRPPAPTGDAAPKVMLMDILVRNAGAPHGTEVLLLGRAEDGASACVRVTGWKPWLLIHTPSADWGGRVDGCPLHAQNASLLKELVEEKLLRHSERHGRGGGERRRRQEFIHQISVVTGRSVYGFADPQLQQRFLKIEVVAPFHLAALRDVLCGYEYTGDDGRAVKVPGVKVVMHPLSQTPMLLDGSATSTFNSNIEATLQFCCDVGLHGGQWLGVRDGVSSLDQDDERRRTACAYEWHIDRRDLDILDLDQHSSVAPLRVLSFDLECAGRRGIFPQAREDPVIQIALQFEVYGATSQPPPVLLSLKECDPIDGAEVVSFEDERDLLRAFRYLASAFDVDVFTGFNVLGFDTPYLHDRAPALSGEDDPRPERPAAIPRGAAPWGDWTFGLSVVDDFDSLSRVHGARLRLRETEFVSAQVGKRKRIKATLPGCAVLDIYVVLQNSQHRLESYKLDSVAHVFLGDNKVDLPFTQITPRWTSGPAGRQELGVYCLKDAELPLRLNAKLNCLLQTVEMARCTGISFDDVLQRGSMLRCKSLLLRRALARNMFFPNFDANRGPSSSSRSEQRYTGATVLDPVCGLHRAVGVLDFSGESSPLCL